MPTNILRKAGALKADGTAKPGPTAQTETREILIRAGRAAIRARLLDTPTAARVWERLPIYTTAETWGQLVHCETHVETGRERTAVRNLKPGQIAFWAEEDRIVIGFGLTPLSRPGEIRLPTACNVWAEALDDVKTLASVKPGERFSVLKSDS